MTPGHRSGSDLRVARAAASPRRAGAGMSGGRVDARRAGLDGRGGGGDRQGATGTCVPRGWMALAAISVGAAATAMDGGRRLTSVSGLVTRRAMVLARFSMNGGDDDVHDG